jgi:deoxyribose-phosphate aldolase
MSLSLSYELIAKRIDHSLLTPTLTKAELEHGCRLAGAYGVASVCIKPYAVSLASRLLENTGVLVGTVIGFPHGANLTTIKVAEARQAMSDGARELDMVINIGQAIGGEWENVAADVSAVTGVAHDGGAIVKVIFENCYLNSEQKVKLCTICGEVGVDYIKTSTGYGSGGATLDDLRLMRKAAPATVKLKAAGGIRDLDSAIQAVEIGCDRLGATRSAEILDELRQRLELTAIAFGKPPVGTGPATQVGAAY